MPSSRRLGRVCELEPCCPNAVATSTNQASDRIVPGGTPHVAGFHWTVLQRHGKRPLAVLSRVLLQADNRCVGLSSWSEVSIYETATSRFAARLRHLPPQVSDATWCDAWLCDNAEMLRTSLYEHDPLLALPLSLSSDLGGMYAERHELVAEAHFRGAWAGLLAAVFGQPSALRRSA